MKSLVIGGAGFIGSHVAELLVREGHKTRVYDNFSTGSAHNLKDIRFDIEIIEGDICDLDTLEPAMAGCDWVFHLGALSSVEQSFMMPYETNEKNVLGTFNVFQTALQADVAKVVFSSSCSVYGDGYMGPAQEDFQCFPKSLYAASKLIGESYASCFYQSHGLETICLRYFNVYGPRQSAQSAYAAVIPKFIENVHRNRPLSVFGDGLQRRDFIHVSDVARANLMAAQTDLSNEAMRCFNIGSGESVNILDLIDLLSEINHRELIADFQPARQGEIQYSCADTLRSAEKLGFQSSLSFKQGLSLLNELSSMLVPAQSIL